MADRPGIMLYFSDWKAVTRRLTVEQRGELVTAIMSFAELGEVPDIADPLTAFAFDLLAEKVVRDAERYRERCTKNAYSAYCRERKRHNETPLSFDEWQSVDIERYRTTSTDIETIQLETETEPELETEPETEAELEK